MNQFCLVGKIASLPDLAVSKSGWKSCNVLLEVERPFTNSKGIYESDLINLEVWRGAAETLCAAARLGSWITARGRIQASRPHEREGTSNPCYTLVAEKIEYIH
ncbi:single-stranded DNA-binding protein [Erysipelotrichaceae bacterium RD49]|nr:single-stranded DNA-binding protein [Erysipelotrichaceae bacterium RD49]